MNSLTELRIGYAYYSWDYEFRPEIEDALERDYVISRHLYDEDTLKRVAALLLICPEASPDRVLETVRGAQPRPSGWLGMTTRNASPGSSLSS